MNVLKKVIFFVLLALCLTFLVISILTWNLLLGACSFVIGIGLTRSLEYVGIKGSYDMKTVKSELKAKRKALKSQKTTS